MQIIRRGPRAGATLFGSNGVRGGIACRSYVVGIVGEQLARRVREFLILAADFADRVLCAIVPVDARFAIDIRPMAADAAERTPGAAVFVQGNLGPGDGRVPRFPDSINPRPGIHQRIDVQGADAGCKIPALGGAVSILKSI